MQPVQDQQTRGRFAIQNSPLQGIAKVLQAYLGTKGIGDSNTESMHLGQKYNQGITDALMASQQAREGRPAMPGTPGTPATGPTDNASPMASTPGTPGTPAMSGNDAVANALLIQHPVTRGLGMEMAKKQLELKMFQDALSRHQGGGAVNPAGSGTVLAPGMAGAQGGGGISSSPMGVPLDLSIASDVSGVGKSYLENLAKENAPIAVREGDIARMGPDGQMHSIFANPKGGIAIQRGSNGQPTSASMIPGYVEAQAQSAGAEARAKVEQTAPFDTVTSELAGGGTVNRFKPAIPGFPTTPTPPQGLPAQAQAQPAPAIPAQQPQATSTGAPQMAPAQGVWKTIPKRQVPQGFGQSTFNKTMATEQAQAASKLSTDLGVAATTANQRKALNDQSLELVDKADTGPLAIQQADIKSWIVKYIPGVKESDFANTPSATQELQKDLVNAATQKAKQQFGSRITQSEVMLMLKRGAPNVDMTKAAIKYLIQTDSAQAQYQIEQADHLGEYISRGGDPQRFEGWHAKSFPMTDYLQKAGLGPRGKIVTPDMPKGPPESIDPISGAIRKPAAMPGQGQTPQMGIAPQGIEPRVWEVMTPEERALWK